VAALSFSPSGDKLVACGLDDYHSICIYDTTARSSSGKLLKN